MNDVTGGELLYLRAVADVHIPETADAFSDTSRLLNGLAAAAADAFSFNEDVAAANDPVHPWQEIRATLQAIVGENARRLITTGQSVDDAIAAFLDTDTANASGIISVAPDAGTELARLEFTGDQGNHAAAAGGLDRPSGEDIPQAPWIPAGAADDFLSTQAPE